MKPDHVVFRVINKGDKAVLSDGLFWPLNSSAVLNRTGRFGRAVSTGKINDGAAGSRVLALHFDQGAGASWIVRLAQWRERPEFETRTFEAFQRHLEGVLIKCFGSLHVLNIDLEPAYGTALRTHIGCRFFELNSNTRRTNWRRSDINSDFSHSIRLPPARIELFAAESGIHGVVRTIAVAIVLFVLEILRRLIEAEKTLMDKDVTLYSCRTGAGFRDSNRGACAKS